MLSAGDHGLQTEPEYLWERKDVPGSIRTSGEHQDSKPDVAVGDRKSKRSATDIGMGAVVLELEPGERANTLE